MAIATRTARLARIAIRPEPNKFDDHFLDVVGNQFKFDHPKGLAEWLKNSADAYATERVRDHEQYILLRFRQANPKSESVFECIDFVGLTRRDIDEALKVWGSPDAAKKGTNVATYGGHGNGGKFYQRQMYTTSRIISYKRGVLNVFGFDAERRYGFAKGLVNAAMTLEEALAFADIDELEIPREVRQRWRRRPRRAGFTVVRGERPKKFSGRASVETILHGLRFHPQARRLLSHKQVLVVRHGDPWGDRLMVPAVPPREGFEHPRVIKLPRTFRHNGQTFHFRNGQHPEGKLVLRTSEVPLARSGELAALNTIDILGEIGCIGSYRMNELGFMRYAPESEFIYGECLCPLLEDVDAVSNDREKLVLNDLTQALLEWIRQQVDSLAGEMAEQRRLEKKSRNLQQSSLFNQILDRWKNRFMARLTTELFGGPGPGGGFGGTGGGSDSGDGGGGAGGSGGGDGRGGGTGDAHRHGRRFPLVLLSGHDRDPLDDDATVPFECDQRHPPIYQRDLDIDQGIYWINTSRPLAGKIMDEYGASSTQWRAYLFQRYVDIITKQAVYQLAKRDPQMTADKVDGLIDDVTSRVHDAAAEDLEQFLFDETLTGTASAPIVEGPASETLDSAGE
jgi:hypothetical protein